MKSVTLFVVLVGVAVTFVHACNAATLSSREMKLENAERVLEQKAAMSRARGEAVHTTANRPGSAMPAATQKHSEAKSASAVDTETVMDKVRFDTDSIVEDAKKAAKRAMNLPSSFKDWENRMKQKMAAMKANSRRQDVSTIKTGVQNKEDKIRVASSATRYANPTVKELVKEIEVEGKTPDADSAPYLMPLEEMSQQAAKTMSSNGPMTSPQRPAASKNWEDKLQARIEELKANPSNQWEDMERRVEAMEMKEAKKMSSRGPKTVTLPLVGKEEWKKKAQARIEELKVNPRKWEEVGRHRGEAMDMLAPRRLTQPLGHVRPNGPQYPNF